ncbi:hypothetical protein GCM10009779_25220 [Polymorphospora rubra]|uniref:Uncharacterized protein n=1 Tax=Polymorphospora rubra TaxID=338584 RepID=A0A810N600_9ACTN|nr:hypothetical protein Prubr_39060 [Polymorphospora rubra]
MSVTVRNQHDQAVVRDPGEHTLDYPPCLIHARNDNDHLALDGADRIVRDDATAPGPRGIPGVQLDNALKFVDANGAEAFGTVRVLQTHAATLPET